MKKILLCVAAGFTALGLGLAIFYAGGFLVSIFQMLERETVEIKETAPVETKEIPIEELIYPYASAKTETVEQKNETIEQKDESEVYGFDPTGEYYLIGGAGKQFQGFDGFYIKTMIYEADPNANIRIQESTLPEGYLFNEAGIKLKFVRVFVSEQQISFETVSKKGISYRFEGKFIEAKEVEYKGGKEWAHIEGFLIKLKDGNAIVQSVAHYTYYLGC